MVKRKEISSNRKRSDRPKKTNQRIDNKIYAISKGNRQKSVSEIRAEINEDLDSPISLTRVKGRLKEKGMIGRIAGRKPLLRPVNKQKRLKFAQEHVDWTIDQWKSVLWTDESKFELFGSHRRQYVRMWDTYMVCPKSNVSESIKKNVLNRLAQHIKRF